MVEYVDELSSTELAAVGLGEVNIIKRGNAKHSHASCTHKGPYK